MEQQVDSDFDEIVAKMTDILQNERDRLVGLCQKLTSCGLKVSYQRTEEFSKLLGMLENVKIGIFDAISSAKDTSSISRAEESLPNDKTRVSDNRNRKRTARPISVYGNMEPVATLELRHLGSPHSIIALPDKHCFAILHPGRLTFVSPSGNLMSSHLISEDKREKDMKGNCHYYCPHIIACNPLENQLISVGYGRIKLLMPLTDWPPASGETIQAKMLIRDDYESPLGLAVSPSTNRSFTGLGHCIASYSLTDWQPQGRCHMGWLDRSDCPFVLTVSTDGKLFFRRKCPARELFTVAIDEASGKLDLDSETVFTYCSPHLLNIALDTYNNTVLAIDDHTCSFQVFDKEGDRLCEVPCFKAGTRRYGKTVGLATMAVPPGGELFSFQDGQILCSNIAAVADYGNGSVIFLGSCESS